MHNKLLADKLGISQEARDTIDAIHLEVATLFKNITEVTEVVGHKAVNRLITGLDTQLQLLWGFKIDEAYQTLWLRNPECTCPKLDNYERVGTGTWYINMACPYHGNKGE